MPNVFENINIRIASSLRDVNPELWNACAGQQNPFIQYNFLSALEDSGSASAETGWAGQHLIIESANHEKYLGIAPVYLKSHSYGEYVFDWGWADAYERAGGKYFPKLLCGVPFTPVTGPRLIVSPSIEDHKDYIRATLIDAMIQIAEQLDLSSIHVNFLEKEEWKSIDEKGFLQRQGQQFHWENKGYKNFGDFLTDLSSRKRKNIRKERSKVEVDGLNIRTLTGNDITEAHWDVFYDFYRNTSDRKWGYSYLNRNFFSLLGERCKKNVVLIYAEMNGSPIAGALNLKGTDCLFGRNWGSSDKFKFLHFEACYYRAIDYAIANDLKRVEAGAQGPHKIQRGYLPSPTYSAHWIKNQSFRRAVAHFLEEERLGIKAEMNFNSAHSPFRKSPNILRQ